MRKPLSIILTLAMVVTMVIGSAGSVFAADTAVATTMKIAGTDGTVTITTDKGKDIAAKVDTKLLNGYTIKTAAASYCFISLDDSKAIKLGQNTKVKVEKSGKKIELSVKSGEIYFDVDKKLSGNESMNIKTGNLTTGIRGTSGDIKVRHQNSGGDSVYLVSSDTTTTIFNLYSGVTETKMVSGPTATERVSAGSSLSAGAQVIIKGAAELNAFAARAILEQAAIKGGVSVGEALTAPTEQIVAAAGDSLTSLGVADTVKEQLTAQVSDVQALDAQIANEEQQAVQQAEAAAQTINTAKEEAAKVEGTTSDPAAGKVLEKVEVKDDAGANAGALRLSDDGTSTAATAGVQAKPSNSSHSSTPSGGGSDDIYTIHEDIEPIINPNDPNGGTTEPVGILSGPDWNDYTKYDVAYIKPSNSDNYSEYRRGVLQGEEGTVPVTYVLEALQNTGNIGDEPYFESIYWDMGSTALDFNGFVSRDVSVFAGATDKAVLISGGGITNVETFSMQNAGAGKLSVRMDNGATSIPKLMQINCVTITVGSGAEFDNYGNLTYSNVFSIYGTVDNFRHVSNTGDQPGGIAVIGGKYMQHQIGDRGSYTQDIRTDSSDCPMFIMQNRGEVHMYGGQLQRKHTEVSSDLPRISKLSQGLSIIFGSTIYGDGSPMQTTEYAISVNDSTKYALKCQYDTEDGSISGEYQDSQGSTLYAGYLWITEENYAIEYASGAEVRGTAYLTFPTNNVYLAQEI